MKELASKVRLVPTADTDAELLSPGMLLGRRGLR